VADAARFLGAAAVAGLTAPILVGVFLLESAAMARFMNGRVPGAVVPPDVVRGLEKARDPVAYGLDLAREIVRWARGAHGAQPPASRPALSPRPAGVHVMSLNRQAAVLDVLR